MPQIHEQEAAGLWRQVGAVVGGWRQRLGRALDDARSRSALRNEFAHLEQAGELDLVLDDIGLSRAAVPTLVHNHPGAARRLAGMLKRLRIEPSQETQNGAEMRAIQRSCLLCAVSGHCERWLASGSNEDPHQFCPNGSALDELVVSGKATYSQKP
jgi:hypothetical protein